MNRICLGLFDMQNRILGPYLAATHRILISVMVRTGGPPPVTVTNKTIPYQEHATPEQPSVAPPIHAVTLFQVVAPFALVGGAAGVAVHAIAVLVPTAPLTPTISRREARFRA
jgi:hypothetical protein